MTEEYYNESIFYDSESIIVSKEDSSSPLIDDYIIIDKIREAAIEFIIPPYCFTEII